MKELINENSKRPNICFRAVDILEDAFGRHIDWGSDVNIFKVFFGKFSKPKISYLGLPVVQEHIGNLQISVGNMVLSQIL